jgi:hypothetical protein
VREGVAVTDHPARRLLEVAPSAYVDERARLAKEYRAAGDRQLAKAIQALKRPTLAVWAVVAAGDDAGLVRSLFDATAALGEAQAAGDRVATVTATKQRKDVVAAVTGAAVDALRVHEPSAEARRPEIRTMVDQLSRHPDLSDAWIDGTLRELPKQDGFGFAAFAGLEVTPSGQTGRVETGETRKTGDTAETGETPPKRARALRSVPDAPTEDRIARDPDQERADRAARAARVTRANERRDAIRARDRAASALVSAQKRLAGAQELYERALADLQKAEAEHHATAMRHAAAVERVESLAD